MNSYLLTGVDFSRNGGGWLASEAFEYLIGDPLVTRSASLRAMLWKYHAEGGFESAPDELDRGSTRRSHVPFGRGRLGPLRGPDRSGGAAADLQAAWVLQLEGRRSNDMMILGGGKAEASARFPVLRWYIRVLKECLARPDAKLMVIGYEFRDRNINEILETALALSAHSTDQLRGFFTDRRCRLTIDTDATRTLRCSKRNHEFPGVFFCYVTDDYAYV